MTRSPASRLTLRRGFGLLGEHLRGSSGILVLVLVLSVFGAVTSLVQPLLVNGVITAVGDGSALRPFIVGLLAAVVLSSVAGAIQQYLLGRTAETMVRSLRYALLDRLLRLPMGAYRRHRTGDLVSRVGSDTVAVRSALTGGVVDAVGGVLVIVGSAVAMLWLDWLLFLVAFGVLSAAVLTVVLASGRIRELARRVQESTGAMSSGVERALSALPTVRAAVATDAEVASLLDDADAAWRASLTATSFRRCQPDQVRRVCSQPASARAPRVAGHCSNRPGFGVGPKRASYAVVVRCAPVACRRPLRTPGNAPPPADLALIGLLGRVMFRCTADVPQRYGEGAASFPP